MKTFTRLNILVILAIIIAGCSSNHKPMDTTAPGYPHDPSAKYPVADPDAVIYPHASFDNGLESGTGVFAMFNLHIDRDNMYASLDPIRSASDLGDVYQTDITNFLNSMCSDCFTIVGLALTEEGYVEVSFRLKHPVPIPENISLPKPGDRLDLHLFDVRGIVFAEGSQTFPGLKSDVSGNGVADEVIITNPNFLRNAHGYTTFFDAYVDANIKNTNANLHPYRRFFEDPREGNYRPDLSEDNGWLTLTAPQGHNVFPQGDRTDVVTYVFDIGSGSQIDLLMLLDACYGHSAVFGKDPEEVGSRMNPRYFLPEFQRKEAWRTTVNITNNNLAHGDQFSNASLSISVWDWQAGMISEGPIDFYRSELTEISQTSDVETVEVYVPGVMNEPKTQPANVIGKGTWTEPYVYTFVIHNQQNAEPGTYHGIVAVRDTLVGSTDGPTGITRELGQITITDFTNYQLFKVDVAEGPSNYPPMCIIMSEPYPPMIQSGGQVEFDASASYDTDGEIILYEWDFDFDGVFTVEATGATPPPKTFYSRVPGMMDIFFVVMRAVDDGDPQMDCMDGIEVIVEPSTPPKAIMEVYPQSPFSECDLITLDGTSSYDEDGEIVSYEWDFNYDPDTPEFNVDAEGPVIQRRFSAGTHDIMLRVIDNTGLDGVTRKRLFSEPLQGMPGEAGFCGNYPIGTEGSTLNSHTFMGAGQKGVVRSHTDAVVAFWVDEGDVAGGPAIKFAASLDGGSTFSEPQNANTELIGGDSATLRPSVVMDHTGTVHLGYAAGDGSYYYKKSTQWGNFQPPVFIDTGEINFGGPSITIDFEGNINFFYTGQAIGDNIPLKLARSIDGGSSFEAPVTIVDDGRFPVSDNSDFGPVIVAFEGKNTDTGDPSDIQVCYQRAGSIYYPPIRVVDSNPNQGRSTKPSMVVDMMGTVHIAWQDSRFGDTDDDYDIFYAYSSTGLSFSTNLRVNDTLEGPGGMIQQTDPSIGIDAMGRPCIAWVDYRDGSGGDIYFSFAMMYGMPFNPNIRINDDLTSPEQTGQGPPILDVSDDGGIVIIWADERNATSGLGDPFTGPSDIYYTFGRLF